MDEFTVKVAPNMGKKKHNVFKLHKDDMISWTEAKMRREHDYQPWQIKAGSGRNGRRFKAIKDGGVGDNASYYIFYKPKDKQDTYEVCPIDEWYSVSATMRFRTLTAEEAEQKFEERNKMYNYFSVMHRKKNGDASEEGLSAQDSKAFKVSELDDWDNSDDDEGSELDNDDPDSKAKKNRRKKLTKKEDPEDAPDEGKEESDEGDFEQREVDYMSDSSSSSEEDGGEKKDENDVRDIAEEEALRDLLDSDEEEEGENPQQKGFKSGNNRSALGTVDIRHDLDDVGSDDSSDSEDYDVDEEKMDSMLMKKGIPTPMVKQEIKQEQEPSTSRQQSNSNKRKMAPDVSPSPSQPNKRPCTSEIPLTPPNGQEKIVEDLIRKYLSRKPMTLKTLLTDIKSKLRRMQGASTEMDNELVSTIASIIKRLQPDKQKINDVIYLSLKS